MIFGQAGMFSMPSSPHTDRPFFNHIDIDQIARETQFVQRASDKFCPSKYMQVLLDAVITGEASLSSLANGLGDLVGKPMTAQAFHQRLGETSSDFVLEVFGTLVGQDFSTRVKRLKTTKFKRVLIQDSTRNRMHRGNAHHFPSFGNGRVETSEVKIDLAYDLLTGELESSTRYEATEQDKTIGKDLIDNILPDDLVIRDMGYYVISEFARIEQVGAYWISRLPVHTKVEVIEDEGSRTLEEVLQKTSANTRRIDLLVHLGNAKHPCRIIAERASQKLTKDRRKDRKENGSQQTQKTGAIRDGWHILITNIDREELTPIELMKLYRMRWDVEIQFRAWKQSLNLDKALDRSTSPHHIYALIMAAMIHMILMMKYRHIAQGELPPGKLSLEKLAKSLSQFISKADRFERFWDFEIDIRHVKKGSRKRKIPVAEGIGTLT
ncbi:MAG: IS4 family transposase [Bacteroidota bacterium]